MKQEQENMTHLFDDYFIEADEYQYILKKEVIRKRKDSNETYASSKILGYFPTIASVLKRCIRDNTMCAINNGKLNELKDLVSHLEDLTKRVEKLVID